VWSASSGELLQTLEGHTCEVKSVCFSSDGSFIRSRDWEEEILFWRRPLPSSAFALVDRSEAASVAFQDTSTSTSASAFLPKLGTRVTVFVHAGTRLCAVYESGPHASAGPAHQWEALVPGMLNASGPELPAWVSFYYHAE
jgi:hypothetical protein